jgi:hypothetical protein
MRKPRVIALSAAILVILQYGQAPLFSHHSNSAFAVETVHSLTGVVKEWQWSNPHTWLHVVVDDGKGGKTEWALEGRAPGILLRAGWSRSIFKAGDTVMVHYSPAKDGTKVGMIARVTLSDGRILPNAPPAVD